MRKKPPGKVLASAHAVEREFQVLEALAETAVPVPIARSLCRDSAVLGTPFYVMDHVQVQPPPAILPVWPELEDLGGRVSQVHLLTSEQQVIIIPH